MSFSSCWIGFLPAPTWLFLLVYSLEIVKFHQYNLLTVSSAESILLIEWPGFGAQNGRAKFYG